MGLHKFPVSYSLKGKMPGSRKEEAKNGFHVAHIAVREVSEIDTNIIGIVKHENYCEAIRFFEGKFWIKDEYQSEDAFRIRRSGNLIRREMNEGCASTFIDSLYSADIKKFKGGEFIDENTIGLRSVTENKKDEALKSLSDKINDNLIEIDGELYIQISEPIYEVFTSKEPGHPKAYVGIAFLKYEDEYSGRRSLYEYDFSFRFPFNKREQLDDFVDHLRNDHGIEPITYSDGEYYYGGEFTPIDDDRKNLLNAARHLVEEKWSWDEWPVAQLTAWGNLRDVYKQASTLKKEDVPEDVMDALSDALKAYEGLQGRDTIVQLSTHARAAVHKWENRVIDLVSGFEETENFTL
jgi:hypothetical protein